MVGNAAYVINDNLMRGHFSVTGSGPGADTWIGAGFTGATPAYVIDYNRPLTQVSQPVDYGVPNAPPFAGYNSVHDVQSYVDARQIAASPDLRQYAFDFRHYNGSTGIDLESPNQTIGTPTGSCLAGGDNLGL